MEGYKYKKRLSFKEWEWINYGVCFCKSQGMPINNASVRGRRGGGGAWKRVELCV